MADERDPELPGLLLRTERDLFVPLLREAADRDFELRTACPGWTVRDVLAHCGAALTRVVEGRFERGVFSPEANDRDIAERAGWTNARVVDELERGMTGAGPVIAASGGKLDGIALGEWVHAGDVREAFGVPGAYAGPGLDPALDLFAAVTRDRGTVPLTARLTGADGELALGAEDGERERARYAGDGATLIRLYAGRPLTGTRYELTGARESELNLFG
ncbi:maleylpyruvate isomerase family mycothiol-dependent enzyme [Streptomyces sp. NPDC055992]|uniref:maleylpyruvate isomerase family mycothiol-dependent enzyme n=1 Tax=Streptomyces sp. NPDC055992 TaxID=3345673 RepID=UPI0035DABF48